MDTSQRHGLLAGVMILLLYLCVYLVRADLLFHPALYFISFLPVLAMQYKAAQQSVVAGGTTKDHLRAAFIVFCLSSLMYYVFIHVILTADAQAGIYWQEQRIALTELILGDELPDEALEDMVLPSISQWFFRFIFGLLGGFLLSYIIASFAKTRA